MNVEQIEIEIDKLSEEDFWRLRRWFAEKYWIRWDIQLELDVTADKLSFLLNEASTAKTQGMISQAVDASQRLGCGKRSRFHPGVDWGQR